MAKAPSALAALKQFAEATGGRNYFSGKEQDLEKIMSDIEGEIDSLFSVTLAPANPRPGGRVYKIELKCAAKSGKKNISIGAPRQYFAPAQ